jgi:hypothetical protein
MVYTVKESPIAVSQFYINQCANQGWKLESALQANGTVLVFTRPGKKLWVTASPTGVANRSTLLILNYTPDDGTSSSSLSGPLNTPNSSSAIHSSPL